MLVAYIKKNGQTASLRTRKIINERGPEFEIVKHGIENSIRSDHLLLRSLKTNWIGWVPSNELVIIYSKVKDE
jgi:hypothetical protein